MKSQQPYQNTFKNRVAEFEGSSSMETLTPPKPKSKRGTKKVVDANNPYLKAREEVLAEMADWRREVILKMEEDGETDHRWYDEFVKLIAEKGDSFTSSFSE